MARHRSFKTKSECIVFLNADQFIRFVPGHVTFIVQFSASRCPPVASPTHPGPFKQSLVRSLSPAPHVTPQFPHDPHLDHSVTVYI